ncbi:MAG: DNA-3-methyladenine glycosylase 2 family protein [Defluviitaleaceae bacterium]|nr:DNA-3-methyladenine glycosylase 2 family protein [Defluviitaleaceae bacterium]
MDYTKVEQRGNDTVLVGIKNFDLAQILDCGQCFRWEADEAGYTGIAHGRRLKLRLMDGNLVFVDVSIDEYEALWKDYLDLGRDYGAILQDYSADSSLLAATAFSPGIRVMCQDPWETLITFILSQNSNIPRIKKMVDGLCRRFGEELAAGGYTFPAPEALAHLTPEDLSSIKPGYRAPYIIDAARQVASGYISLDGLKSQSTDDIRKALLRIHGVGPKVADCVLLFGFSRVEVCPMDVWMKRVMSKLYPDGFPEGLMATAGIAQQYLFHYGRNFPEVLE